MKNEHATLKKTPQSSNIKVISNKPSQSKVTAIQPPTKKSDGNEKGTVK